MGGLGILLLCALLAGAMNHERRRRGLDTGDMLVALLLWLFRVGMVLGVVVLADGCLGWWR